VVFVMISCLFMYLRGGKAGAEGEAVEAAACQRGAAGPRRLAWDRRRVGGCGVRIALVRAPVRLSRGPLVKTMIRHADRTWSDGGGSPGLVGQDLGSCRLTSGRRVRVSRFSHLASKRRIRVPDRANAGAPAVALNPLDWITAGPRALACTGG